MTIPAKDFPELNVGRIAHYLLADRCRWINLTRGARSYQAPRVSRDRRDCGTGSCIKRSVRAS